VKLYLYKFNFEVSKRTEVRL